MHQASKFEFAFVNVLPIFAYLIFFVVSILLTIGSSTLLVCAILKSLKFQMTFRNCAVRFNSCFFFCRREVMAADDLEELEKVV